jgi:hypothetical protein
MKTHRPNCLGPLLAATLALLGASCAGQRESESAGPQVGAASESAAHDLDSIRCGAGSFFSADQSGSSMAWDNGSPSFAPAIALRMAGDTPRIRVCAGVIDVAPYLQPR